MTRQQDIETMTDEQIMAMHGFADEDDRDSECDCGATVEGKWANIHTRDCGAVKQGTPTAIPFVRYLEPRSDDMPDVRITLAPDATVRLAQGGNVVTVHPDDLAQLRELLHAAEREADRLSA